MQYYIMTGYEGELSRADQDEPDTGSSPLYNHLPPATILLPGKESPAPRQSSSASTTRCLRTLLEDAGALAQESRAHPPRHHHPPSSCPFSLPSAASSLSQPPPKFTIKNKKSTR